MKLRNAIEVEYRDGKKVRRVLPEREHDPVAKAKRLAEQQAHVLIERKDDHAFVHVRVSLKFADNIERFLALRATGDIPPNQVLREALNEAIQQERRRRPAGFERGDSSD